MHYRTHGEAEKGPQWAKQPKTQQKGKQPKWSKPPQQQWTPPRGKTPFRGGMGQKRPFQPQQAPPQGGRGRGNPMRSSQTRAPPAPFCGYCGKKDHAYWDCAKYPYRSQRPTIHSMQQTRGFPPVSSRNAGWQGNGESLQ